VFYLSFKICIHFCILIFYEGRIPVNSCWHLSSGMCATVWETMHYRITVKKSELESWLYISRRYRYKL